MTNEIVTIEGIPLKEFSKEGIDLYFRHVNLFRKFIDTGKREAIKQVEEVIDEFDFAERSMTIEFNSENLGEMNIRLRKELKQKMGEIKTC